MTARLAWRGRQHGEGLPVKGVREPAGVDIPGEHDLPLPDWRVVRLVPAGSEVLGRLATARQVRRGQQHIFGVGDAFARAFQPFRCSTVRHNPALRQRYQSSGIEQCDRARLASGRSPIEVSEQKSCGNQCGDDRPEQIIADVAQTIFDTYGIDGLNQLLSPGQAANAEWARRMYRGTAIHELVAQWLAGSYRLADGEARFDYFRRGVDFFDNLTKAWIELTTPGQVRPH